MNITNFEVSPIPLIGQSLMNVTFSATRADDIFDVKQMTMAEVEQAIAPLWQRILDLPNRRPDVETGENALNFATDDCLPLALEYCHERCEQSAGFAICECLMVIHEGPNAGTARWSICFYA